MNKIALITGITGFTGLFLAKELYQAGYQVVGLSHRQIENNNPHISAIYACDLKDSQKLTKIIQDVKPDVVVHLAAISFVAHGNVETIYKTNLLGTRSLLEALVMAKLDLQAVLLASSANVYGNSTSGVISETTPLAPANDYAVSKVAMEYMAKLYQDKLPLIITRPFNYIGVGQNGSFLIPKLVRHIHQQAEVIELGNLDVARDFSDVRTVAFCYHQLLETSAAIGETFNICSGKSYSLREILDYVQEISGHQLKVKINPKFVRENEVKVLLGDKTKLESCVGKVIAIPLIETLSWIIGS